VAESDEYELMIRKAERSLQTARRISADGDYDFAISRAYYGVFYAMRAALERMPALFQVRPPVRRTFRLEYDILTEYGPCHEVGCRSIVALRHPR